MKLNTKDIVSIALFTALYTLISMIAMGVCSMFGIIGHAVSPGFMHLFGGPVIYFMAHKIGKMFQFTFMTLLMCGIFSLMGAAYLPWFISLLVTALIADFMCSKTNKPNTLTLAIANGLMGVGSALGSIIPSVFFAEKFKADWVARGQTADYMDATIKAASGTSGLIVIVVVFVLSFLGIYLGQILLKKHFKQS